MSLPVSSGREVREKKTDPASLIGGLSLSDKKRLVAQYGDLSNDEDDLYPFYSPLGREEEECTQYILWAQFA